MSAPPLPWVVHALGGSYWDPKPCIFVGVFDARTDLLRAIARWIFGHDADLLVQFCLGLAFDAEVTEEFYERMLDDFDYVESASLWLHMIRNADEMCETPNRPLLKISAISSQHFDVYDERNTWRARDVFKGLPFTLTPKQFNAVAEWIMNETLNDHLAILAWCHVVGKRNGFEGRVNSRVMSFLV